MADTTKNELIPVIPEDRNPDGSIKTEVREKVKEMIEKYIILRGYPNYKELSEGLGLKYVTIKSLENEIVKKWREEDSNLIIMQIQWLKNLMKEEDEHPELISEEKDKNIARKKKYLDEINDLVNQLGPIRSSEDFDDSLRFHLFGRIKPRTIEKIIERRKANETDTEPN